MMKYVCGLIASIVLTAGHAVAASACETVEVTTSGETAGSLIARQLAKHGLRSVSHDPDLKINVTAMASRVPDGVDSFGSAISHIQTDYLVEIRMRDGTAVVGQGPFAVAFDPPLTAILSHAATVTVRGEPATATLDIDQPMVAHGTGDLVLRCMSDTAKVQGTASAAGYCKQSFSFAALASPTYVVRLDTTSCAPVVSPVTTVTSAESSMSAIQILGFTFGAVLILSLLVVAIWLTIREKDPPQFAMVLFRIIISIGAGGVGGIFAGWLSVHFKLSDSFVVDAAGGLAMFALVFRYDPPTKLAVATGPQAAPGENKPNPPA